jgi:hypothetical protein
MVTRGESHTKTRKHEKNSPQNKKTQRHNRRVYTVFVRENSRHVVRSHPWSSVCSVVWKGWHGHGICNHGTHGTSRKRENGGIKRVRKNIKSGHSNTKVTEQASPATQFSGCVQMSAGGTYLTRRHENTKKIARRTKKKMQNHNRYKGGEVYAVFVWEHSRYVVRSHPWSSVCSVVLRLWFVTPQTISPRVIL